MSTDELRENAYKKQRKSIGDVFFDWLYSIKRTPFLVKGGFDTLFLVLVLALLSAGLIVLFSASYVNAKYDAETGYDEYFYIKRQAFFAVLGVACMFILSKINPQWIKKFVPIIGVISFILLILVLIAPVEIPGKTNIKRWLMIPGIGLTFQPSDVAKLGLIMMIAWVMEKYRKYVERKPWFTMVLFASLAVVAVLVFAEDHLSGAILMAAIGVCMLYLGGIDNKWIIFGGLLVVALGVIIFVKREALLPSYQCERIDSWLNPDYNDTDSRWQTNQSLFALGSGGFFGLGLGKSKQKFLYMPEPQNDFIFAIAGEELGFLRCLVLLGLFIALVWRGFIIGVRARNAYERLLVLGISCQIAIQTIFNLLVITDLFPNTGISLPFFSYGGTALLITLTEMGLVLGVSRTGPRNRKKGKVKKDVKQ